MALDENGNVRPVGWGKGLAEAISAFASNPKADAEAEAFRTTSSFNKLKLDEAARAAEKDKELDPLKTRLNQLISGWDDPETYEDDPESGSTHRIAIPGKKHAPLFAHDPKNGFTIDRTVAQERLPEYLSLMHRIYGHDALTKMHPFFNQAGIAAPNAGEAPKDFEAATGRTPDGSNAERRYGQPGLINALNHGLAPRTAEQEKIKHDNAVTAANTAGKVKEVETETNARLQLSHGMVQDPRTGEWRIGPDSPIGKLLSGFTSQKDGPEPKKEVKANPEAPTPAVNHTVSGVNPQEVVTPASDKTVSEPNPPDGIPQLFSGGDLNPPATKQYSDDKRSASSGKIADSIAAGGSVTKNKDGSFSFKPSAPSREMNPAEQARQAANDMGVRSLPSETERLKKRELDDQWAGGLAQQVARLVADEDGDAPDLAFIEPVVRQINDLRIDLERRGYDSDEARSLAVRLAVDSYSKYFQTNYEWPGKNKIELKQDPTFGPKGETIFTAHTGKSNTWGRDATPDEVQKTVADDIAGNATEHVPNMYIDKPTYVKKIPDTLTALGVPPDKQSNPDIQALAVGLMWMKDVKEYAPQNGWRFSEPSGVGGGQHVIRTMKDPAAYMKLLDEKIKQYEEYIRNKSK